MGNENIIIQIDINTKEGIAALKALGFEAQKTNKQFEQGAGTGGKFAEGMKRIASNGLQMLGVMKLADVAVKGFVGGIIDLINNSNKLISTKKLLINIQNEAVESTKKEVVSLQTLFAVAKNTELSYGARQAAIQKINKEYPELHRNITLENIGTRETAAAIQSVINNLVNKAKLQGLVSKIAEMSIAVDILNRVAETSNGPVSKQALKRAADINKEMKDLQKIAENIQGSTIGEVFLGDKIGGKLGEVKTAEVKVKPVKLKIEKPEQPVEFNFFGIRLPKDFLSGSLPGQQGGLADYYIGELEKLRNRMPDLSRSIVDSLGIGFEAQMEKGNKMFAEFITKSENAAQLITQTLSPAFESMFDAITNNEDALGAFFKSIGNSVKQLIKQLITAAIYAAALSLITGGSTTIGGVARKGFGNILKGVLGFAEGGLVTGPVSALIGEGRGTNASNPEVVAPLDKLKLFFGDMMKQNTGYGVNANMGTAGANFSMPKSVRLFMSGRDLVGAFELEVASQRRTA